MNGKRSGETARMRRLAWASAVRAYVKLPSVYTNTERSGGAARMRRLP